MHCQERKGGWKSSVPVAYSNQGVEGTGIGFRSDAGREPPRSRIIGSRRGKIRVKQRGGSKRSSFEEVGEVIKKGIGGT